MTNMRDRARRPVRTSPDSPSSSSGTCKLITSLSVAQKCTALAKSPGEQHGGGQGHQVLSGLRSTLKGRPGKGSMAKGLVLKEHTARWEPWAAQGGAPRVNAVPRMAAHPPAATKAPAAETGGNRNEKAAGGPEASSASSKAERGKFGGAAMGSLCGTVCCCSCSLQEQKAAVEVRRVKGSSSPPQVWVNPCAVAEQRISSYWLESELD
jgi:hypothetical protein